MKNTPAGLKTPYYIIDESLLIKNLEILRSVKQRTDCKILLAQKAFSSHYFYPLIGKYLDGCTASGLFEARLGKEKMGKENHIFSPAYKEDEFEEICSLCGHIVFNSFDQYLKYNGTAKGSGAETAVRINPEISTQSKAVYDPCAPYSRMGVTIKNFNEEMLKGITGLHFHTLCEQNSDALEVTLGEVIKKFGKYFGRIKWINFGGGHHITRKDYDIERLVNIINGFKNTYGLTVYLEPGEAVVLNCGFLVSTVLDIVDNTLKTAVLDASAACHMPDVLESPYRPPVAGDKKDGKYLYRLAGNTCLSGDIIGDYRFASPLKTGDRVVFKDMALYTMVKNNTFNGVNLPSVAVKDVTGNIKVIKEFGYNDFISRL